MEIPNCVDCIAKNVCICAGVRSFHDIRGNEECTNFHKELESVKTSHTSDYAAALRALYEYHNLTSLKEAIMPFSEWCRERLNSIRVKTC